MQKHLQGISPLMLFAALTLAAYWIVQNTSNNTSDPSNTTPPLLILHNSTTYRYDDSGNPNTILSTPLITYYTDERGTHFTTPTLIHHTQNSTDTLHANQAIENHTHTIIDMQGNVTATRKSPQKPNSDITLTTSELRYHIPENQIENDVPLSIRTATSTTHAIGTIWHLNQNLFILKKNVRSHYAAD